MRSFWYVLICTKFNGRLSIYAPFQRTFFDVFLNQTEAAIKSNGLMKKVERADTLQRVLEDDGSYFTSSYFVHILLYILCFIASSFVPSHHPLFHLIILCFISSSVVSSHHLLFHRITSFFVCFISSHPSSHLYFITSSHHHILCFITAWLALFHHILYFIKLTHPLNHRIALFVFHSTSQPYFLHNMHLYSFNQSAIFSCIIRHAFVFIQSVSHIFLHKSTVLCICYCISFHIVCISLHAFNNTLLLRRAVTWIRRAQFSELSLR